MQYIITRTSRPGAYDDDGNWTDLPPCDDPRLKLLQVPIWDRRLNKSTNTTFPHGWFTRGSEHTTFPGGIARRTGTEERYIIDFGSPASLLEFISKFPRVVVENAPPSLPEIEIYDDYRE